MYYIGQPASQIPVMAVDTRWWQVAYAWSCCIQLVTTDLMTVCAGRTNWICTNEVRILEKKTNLTSLDQDMPSVFEIHLIDCEIIAILITNRPEISGSHHRHVQSCRSGCYCGYQRGDVLTEVYLVADDLLTLGWNSPLLLHSHDNPPDTQACDHWQRW